MKIKIIAEIGLNHFGKIKIIKDYLARVRNKDIDGVSIQILNKKKTLKKFKKFALKKSDIKKFLIIAKKDFNNVGVAIHSWDDFGRTQETATLEGYGEIYSYDEAATWTDRGGEDW